MQQLTNSPTFISALNTCNKCELLIHFPLVTLFVILKFSQTSHNDCDVVISNCINTIFKFCCENHYISGNPELGLGPIIGRRLYQVHCIELECLSLSIPLGCHSNCQGFIWHSEKLPSRSFQFPSI